MPDERKGQTEIRCQLHVNIEFSSNPKVKAMCDDPELVQEFNAFNKANGVEPFSSEKRPYTGAVTSIDLRGPYLGLKKFVTEYLSGDPGCDLVSTGKKMEGILVWVLS